MVTTREVSCVMPPDVTLHTYSPESAAVTWGMRRREPDTSRGQRVDKSAPQSREQGRYSVTPPPHAPYLVSGGQGATALVPRHGAGTGPCHHAVEVQDLPLSDGRGRGLDAEGLGGPGGCRGTGGGGLSPGWHRVSPCAALLLTLTVIGAGAAGHGDNDGRLLRGGAQGHPAHVLPRIGHCHLSEAQAGPRYLRR